MSATKFKVQCLSVLDHLDPEGLIIDFESDPADEIIAATSLVHRVSLVTRDRRIRRSILVPLAK